MKLTLCCAIVLLFAASAFALREPADHLVDANSSPSFLCLGPSDNWYRSYGIGGGYFTGVAQYTGVVQDSVTTLTGSWYENNVHTSSSKRTGDETLSFEYVVEQSTPYPSGGLVTNWTWDYLNNDGTHSESYELQLTSAQFVDKALLTQYCLVPDVVAAPNRLVGRWFGGNSHVGSGDLWICRSSDGEYVYGSGYGLGSWYFEGTTYDDGLTVQGTFWSTPVGGSELTLRGDIVLRAVADGTIEGWFVQGNSYKENPWFWTSFSRQGNSISEGAEQNNLECSVNEELIETFKKDTKNRDNNKKNNVAWGRPQE